MDEARRLFVYFIGAYDPLVSSIVDMANGAYPRRGMSPG